MLGWRKKEVQKTLQPYEKHDPLLHGRYRTRGDKILSMEFVKKYIARAKAAPEPKMTSEASRIIAEEYTRLRSANLDDSHIARTQPITARSLETLIRLSAAHAKARLAKTVTRADAKAAIELVQYAIFERVEDKEKKKRKADDDYNSDEEMEDDGFVEEADGENGHADGNGTENGNPPKRIRSSTDEPAVEGSGEETERMELEDDEDETGEIADDRYGRFKTRVSELFEMEREQSLGTKKILEWLTAPRQGFTRSEVFGGLERLAAENVIIVAEGIVFLAT